MNPRLISTRDVGHLDELLNRAFELAYFILGDRSPAIYVAMAAMDKLKTASSNQGRRLYYTPTGRSVYPAARTKVNLSELHLLQRLVYVECELFERLIEGQARMIQQDDLIIRYVKHLIRITTKHNSFYVTLGLCRLLYNYSTGDTSEIYNLVLQDPERIRDDYYYRSRKKHLMQDITERFGSLLRIQRGLRREDRFEPNEDSQKYVKLVEQCLVRFAPWQSDCVLPRDLDPNRNVIAPLLFAGANPDQEHEVELNRIHTLIHPACFERLTAALDLEHPSKRLELPAFFASSHGSRPNEDRFHPTELTEGELDAIRRYLDKSSVNRKHFSQTELRLLVDGQRRGDFHLQPSRPLEFDLKPGSEMIEVRSVGMLDTPADATLAVCLLGYDHFGVVPIDARVRLEGGSQLTLNVSGVSENAGEPQGSTLRISYEPRRLLSVGFTQRLQLWLSAVANVAPRRRVLKVAFGVFLLTLSAAALWIYVRSFNGAPDSTKVAKLESRGGNESAPKSPVASALPQQPPSIPRETHRRGAGAIKSRNNQDASDGSARLRGANARPPSATLVSIKRVYVDPLGEDAFSNEFRSALINALKASDRFDVVTNREDADAVIKGSAKLRREPRSIVVELVNAEGQVVWSFSSRTHRRALSSDAKEMAGQVLSSLLREINARPQP